jgi:hypothetical protein
MRDYLVSRFLAPPSNKFSHLISLLDFHVALPAQIRTVPTRAMWVGGVGGDHAFLSSGGLRLRLTSR